MLLLDFLREFDLIKVIPRKKGVKNVGWLFPDKYCLRDSKTGVSESFDTVEEAALFLKMHGANTIDAGGTRTLEALSRAGYDTKGEKHGTLGIFGL